MTDIYNLDDRDTYIEIEHQLSYDRNSLDRQNEINTEIYFDNMCDAYGDIE